jgi:acetyl-CoA carboxylase biotin carboxyl carrier protein
MDLDDIKRILALVREHDLAEFELERDGLKIRVRKAGGAVTFVPTPVAPVAVAPAAPTLAAAPAPASASPGPVAADAPDAVSLSVINSPIVGTFYRSSEPGAAPFVEVGQFVRKGQVLCIIEAMKLMNEIESEADGVITAVHVENSRPVQFGDRLFTLKVSV